MNNPDNVRPADLIEMVRGCEVRFPQEVASCHETAWGAMYLAPENPQGHDSNHAVITDLSADADAALREIVAFYTAHSITPRLRPAFLPSERARLEPALLRQGFRIEVDPPCSWMAHAHHVPQVPVPAELEVRQVRTLDPALLELVHSEGPKPWSEGFLRRQVGAPARYLFVGFVGGRAVSMALLSEVDVVARVDDVRTSPDFRRRGYSRAVMQHLVAEHVATSRKPLYLVSDNPEAIRNYQRCGFEALNTGWESWQAIRPIGSEGE